MLIRLVLTEMQPFEKVKIYEEMYGHQDAVRHSVLMTISLLILTFFNRCNSVKTSLINTELGDFGDLGVLFLTMLINSVVAYSISYRLVPSPSRFEITQ